MVFMLNGEDRNTVWSFAENKALEMPATEYDVFQPHGQLKYSFHELDPYKPKDEILTPIAAQIDAALHDHNVLVHCMYGRDRTGATIGTYRIVYEDWTADEAWDEMKDYSQGGAIPHGMVFRDYLDGLHFLKKAEDKAIA